ncbi:MAG: hypothetical protein N2506_07480 [Dehalococcoidales bacterium]|nr:hypothetical protein [Dehalococcoidales bacterium]
MAEELGRIEKPPVSSFKKGRRLYFVPLVYSGKDLPGEFFNRLDRYWEQVARHLDELAGKLGGINCIYHELVSFPGEEGMKTIEKLNEKSAALVRVFLEKKARLEALEEDDILTEYMDWSRCLILGLQNPRVTAKVYDFYVEAGRKRNECLARRINETLKENETGLLLMREEHQVQFPNDIEVFYIAPPALDELKRWLRDYSRQVEEKRADD